MQAIEHSLSQVEQMIAGILLKEGCTRLPESVRLNLEAARKHILTARIIHPRASNDAKRFTETPKDPILSQQEQWILNKLSASELPRMLVMREFNRLQELELVQETGSKVKLTSKGETLIKKLTKSGVE